MCGKVSIRSNSWVACLVGDLAVWHLLLDSFFHAMPVAHHPSAGWASVDCYFGWHFVSEKVNQYDSQEGSIRIEVDVNI